MFFTPSGRLTEVRFEHPQNALFPMLVTLVGMITDVNPMQVSNAHSPMQVIPNGITVFLQPDINLLVDFSIIALHSFLESYIGLEGSTTIDAKLIHSTKAILLISVTLLGITIDINFLHSANLQVVLYQ